MKVIPLAVTALIGLYGPALAMSDTECTTMWTQADVNADGALNGSEAERYTAWMRSTNKTVADDGIITHSA